MSSSLSSLSAQTSSLQSSHASLQASLSALEGRLSACREDSSSALAAVGRTERTLSATASTAERALKEVRDVELRSKDSREMIKQEMLERIHAVQSVWTDDKMTTDRRIAVTEAIANDCLHHLKDIPQIVDKLIKTHPQMGVLCKNTENLEHLTTHFSVVDKLKQEFQELTQQMHKLSANGVLLADFLLLREKVYRTELTLISYQDYSEQLTKLASSHSLVTNKLSGMEILTSTIGEEVGTMKRAVQTLQADALHSTASSSVLMEEVKRATEKMRALEVQVTKDVLTLKDLSGSFANRLQMSESKATAAARTAASEVKQITMRLDHMDARLLSVSAGAGYGQQQQMPRMMVQQQEEEKEAAPVPREPVPAAPAAVPAVSVPVSLAPVSVSVSMLAEDEELVEEHEEEERVQVQQVGVSDEVQGFDDEASSLDDHSFDHIPSLPIVPAPAPAAVPVPASRSPTPPQDTSSQMMASISYIPQLSEEEEVEVEDLEEMVMDMGHQQQQGFQGSMLDDDEDAESDSSSSSSEGEEEHEEDHNQDHGEEDAHEDEDVPVPAASVVAAVTLPNASFAHIPALPTPRAQDTNSSSAIPRLDLTRVPPRGATEEAVPADDDDWDDEEQDEEEVQQKPKHQEEEDEEDEFAVPDVKKEVQPAAVEKVREVVPDPVPVSSPVPAPVPAVLPPAPLVTQAASTSLVVDNSFDDSMSFVQDTVAPPTPPTPVTLSPAPAPASVPAARAASPAATPQLSMRERLRLRQETLRQSRQATPTPDGRSRSGSESSSVSAASSAALPLPAKPMHVGGVGTGRGVAEEEDLVMSFEENSFDA